MILLVSGSRSINDKNWVFKNLLYFCKKYNIDCIVGGGCSRGVDSFLFEFCSVYSLKYIEMKANWKKYGKRGGFVRNKEMVDYVKSVGGLCCCFWDKKSKGCKNVIDLWGSGCGGFMFLYG